jgi:hypothetical protein
MAFYRPKSVMIITQKYNRNGFKFRLKDKDNAGSESEPVAPGDSTDKKVFFRRDFTLPP